MLVRQECERQKCERHQFFFLLCLGWTWLILCFSSGARIGLPGLAQKQTKRKWPRALTPPRFLALIRRWSGGRGRPMQRTSTLHRTTSARGHFLFVWFCANPGKPMRAPDEKQIITQVHPKVKLGLNPKLGLKRVTWVFRWLRFKARECNLPLQKITPWS